MKRVVQAGGVLIVLLLIAAAAVPSHVEITVTPVQSDRGWVSGRVESEGYTVAFHDQHTPWAHRVTGRHVSGWFEAHGDGRIQVRAVLFKGALPLSELRLTGTRVSLVKERRHFSGRAR